MINIQLEKMEAAVLALYLESLREGIEKKPINNLNEQMRGDRKETNQQFKRADFSSCREKL
jgi:hypothetical protein